MISLEMEQRKGRGEKRVRLKERNCIFSARMETVAKVQAVFLLSLWMLPLKAHQQVFLWSGQVNKATWIWMRKQSWSQIHLLLTPLSGRRWGIHVWKGKIVKGGGICLHKKTKWAVCDNNHWWPKSICHVKSRLFHKT